MAIEVRRRPYDHSFSGNPIHYQLFSDAAAADASIFFEYKVLIKNIGDVGYTEVVTLQHYPTAGLANIDIKDILDSKLEFKIPEFNVDETVYSTAEKQTAKYYIQVREISTASPDPAWDDSENEFERVVLKGGLNYFMYRGNNYWLNYYASQKPFLTWQKTNRLAALTERMYLAWLNSVEEADSIPVKITTAYTDGTTEAHTILIAGTKDSIIFIPAGATQLGLPDLDPEKAIYYWELQVTAIIDGADPINVSEAFRYYADNRNDYNDITLNYRDSLGGLDSVRVRGVIEHDLNYEFTEQDRTFEPNYFDGDSIAPKRVIANSKERKIYKGDIGYLAKEDQDRFRDSHLIREVWWERSVKWFPVVFITPSQKQKTSEDNLWSFPIQFALASDGDNYYTPDAVDLGDGAFTSNVCRAAFLELDVAIDLSGDDAVVTITWEVPDDISDPDAVATQYTHQVIGTDGEPILGNLSDGSLVLTLPKDAVYTLEMRVMCPNNIPGKKSVVSIDTNEPEEGGGTINSNLFNFSSTGSDYDIKVAGVSIKSGHVNAFEMGITFHADDASDVTVTIELGFNPGSAQLNVGATLYTGSISSHVVTFSHVNIIDGFQIRLH